MLAYFVVQPYTHNPLLAGIAFSVGFVALLLARSELFTENFLVPVVNVAAGHRSIWALLRLWSITLVANLLGGWSTAWLIVTGRPDLKETAVEVSDHYFELGINLHSFVLAPPRPRTGTTARWNHPWPPGARCSDHPDRSSPSGQSASPG